MTAVYTTALSIGLTAAFVLTVPIADAFGVLARRTRRVGGRRRRRRPSLARTAARATRHPDPDARPEPRDRFRDVARTRLGLAMAGFFGLQSLQAYAVFGWFATLWRDAGLQRRLGRRAGRAGGRDVDPALGVGAAAMARPGNQRGVLIGVMLLYPVGYVGLMVAPHSLAVLWAVVLGVAHRRRSRSC